MSVTREQLERMVDERRAALRAAEAALREARVSAAPFDVGDEVEAWTHANGWQPAIVRAIEFRVRTPWYIVSFRKKDGEWASQQRRVFEKVWVPVKASA